MPLALLRHHLLSRAVPRQLKWHAKDHSRREPERPRGQLERLPHSMTYDQGFRIRRLWWMVRGLEPAVVRWSCSDMREVLNASPVFYLYKELQTVNTFESRKLGSTASHLHRLRFPLRSRSGLKLQRVHSQMTTCTNVFGQIGMAISGLVPELPWTKKARICWISFWVSSSSSSRLRSGATSPLPCFLKGIDTGNVARGSGTKYELCFVSVRR